MDFTIFKDFLFDLINESDMLDAEDVYVNDKNDLLYVTMKDGSRFCIHIEEVMQ